MTNSGRRMESFDQFFLFITSALGLFFSLLYTLLDHREVVYGFLPLLIIGLVIPIYIGYVRGAILLDTLEERVRGWIYFLIGVIFYLISVVFLVVDKAVVMQNVEFQPLSRLLIFAANVLVAYFFGRGWLRRWFCRNLFKAFNRESTKLVDRIYADTSHAAFVTSLLFYISFSLSLSENLDPVIVLYVIFNVFIGVLNFVLSEYDVRKWMPLLRFSDFIEIKSKRVRPRIPPRVMDISFVVFLITAGLTLLLFEWIAPILISILVIIAGFSMILLLLSGGRKYTIKIKKEVPKEVETELTRLIERITKKKEKDKER